MIPFTVLNIIIIQKKKRTRHILAHHKEAATLPWLNRYSANKLAMAQQIFSKQVKSAIQNRREI